MNKRQREEIIDIYIQWKNCGMSADPSGFYCDFGDFISRLKSLDAKLSKELEDAEEEWINN